MKLRRLKIDVVHFAHEKREPLVDALANCAGARVRASYNPDDWISSDDFEHIGEADLKVRAGLFVRIYRRKPGLFRRVFHNERHADRDDQRDSCGNPKQPTPMQRRNPD